MKPYKHIQNVEALKRNLETILEEIHTLEDPYTITEYRKFFKKNISFFNRSFVSAYLLKKYLSSSRTTSSKNGTAHQEKGRERRERTTTQETKNQHSTQSTREKPTQNNNSRPRRISVNVGSEFAPEQEVIAFLISAPQIQPEDISTFKQTARHTVIMINANKTSALLQFVKANMMNGKKLYIDMRGQY